MFPDPETRATAEEACQHLYCILLTQNARKAHLGRLEQKVLTVSPGDHEAENKGSVTSCQSVEASITQPQQAGISVGHSCVSLSSGSKPICKPPKMLHWLLMLAQKLRLPQAFSLIKALLSRLFWTSRPIVLSPSCLSDAALNLPITCIPAPEIHLPISHPAFATADSAVDVCSQRPAASAQGCRPREECLLLTGHTYATTVSTSSISFAADGPTGSCATSTSARSSRQTNA